jgi:hypothetical protein
MGALKALFKQPYWIITLVSGVALVALPCVTVDKDYHWAPHPPKTFLPVAIGGALLLVSFAAFWYTSIRDHGSDRTDVGGVDLNRTKEEDGVLWTTVSGCEIRVVNGRIEDYAHADQVAVVLPCYEYFDKECIGDERSALGAYARWVFKERWAEFASLVESEAVARLGPGTQEQKTHEARGCSFGVGKCLLLVNPLGSGVTTALVSTTTQRAGEGLVARISHLFDGMREVFTCLADKRINEVAMPILGAGHCQLDPPLAFVGLLLAVAEAARYGRGGQRPRKVTIIVFKKDADSSPQVEKIVVRRALALVGSQEG